MMIVIRKNHTTTSRISRERVTGGIFMPAIRMLFPPKLKRTLRSTQDAVRRPQRTVRGGVREQRWMADKKPRLMFFCPAGGDSPPYVRLPGGWGQAALCFDSQRLGKKRN